MTTTGYASISDLRAELGTAGVSMSTADDAVLLSCLDDAQGYIEGPAGVGRCFQVTADTTRTLDGIRDVADYFLTLWLDEDLCQITSVTNGDGTVISPSLYVTNPRNRTPYYSLQFKWSASSAWTFNTTPENSITIVGRWGYSTQAPTDIRRAHRRLAAYYYRLRDAQTFDVTTNPLTGQMTIPKGVPADVELILKNYRRTTPV